MDREEHGKEVSADMVSVLRMKGGGVVKENECIIKGAFREAVRRGNEKAYKPAVAVSKYTIGLARHVWQNRLKQQSMNGPTKP